jgi:hypothetical protein
MPDEQPQAQQDEEQVAPGEEEDAQDEQPPADLEPQDDSDVKGGHHSW